MVCFCLEYKKTGLGKIDDTLYGNTDDAALPQQSICKQFGEELNTAYVLNQSVSMIIVAVNYILRLFIIKAIFHIGMDTESGQTQLITDGVFIV